MASHANTLEIEKKVFLSPSDLEHVFHALQAQASTKVKIKQRPRDYYDTVKLDLYARQVALRVQYKKDRYEQTIKAPFQEAGDKDGLARYEWKFSLSDNKPDFSVINDDRAITAISGIAPEKLRHLFTADVVRRYFEMKVTTPTGQGTVEIAFDRGQIRLADKYAKKYGAGEIVDVCEVEVEMIEGDSRAMDHVIDRIIKMAPSARLSSDSKNALGVDLFKRARQAAGKTL